ncbi:MAG: helix-turn-helix transcriptional regulator [Thermomicrobiales bacterium]
MFGLSRREREVLQLVAAGMTDAEVAAQLSISYRTVTTHLTSIFNKLGVNSRVLATRIAVENDLIE